MYIDSMERFNSQKTCAGLRNHLLTPIYSVNISKIPIRHPGPDLGAAEGGKVPKINFGGFGDPVTYANVPVG